MFFILCLLYFLFTLAKLDVHTECSTINHCTHFYWERKWWTEACAQISLNSIGPLLSFCFLYLNRRTLNLMFSVLGESECRSMSIVRRSSKIPRPMFSVLGKSECQSMSVIRRSGKVPRPMFSVLGESECQSIWIWIWILRMTVLGRGLIIQTVPLIQWWHHSNITEKINIIDFHQSLHTQQVDSASKSNWHGIRIEQAKRYKVTRDRFKRRARVWSSKNLRPRIFFAM